MTVRNLYEKIEHFSEITTEKSTMAVFLTIAKNRGINLERLLEKTGMGLDVMSNSIKKLEEGGFIARNPGPLSRKFKLGFNGQLFAEQLKTSYPQVEKLLGRKSLIEPLE